MLNKFLSIILIIFLFSSCQTMAKLTGGEKEIPVRLEGDKMIGKVCEGKKSAGEMFDCINKFIKRCKQTFNGTPEIEIIDEQYNSDTEKLIKTYEMTWVNEDGVIVKEIQFDIVFHKPSTKNKIIRYSLMGTVGFVAGVISNVGKALLIVLPFLLL